MGRPEEVFASVLSRYLDALKVSPANFSVTLLEVQRQLGKGAGAKANLQPLVNSWCKGDRTPSKYRIAEIAVAIFQTAATEKKLNPEGTLKTDDGIFSDSTLTDVVNTLQTAAGFPPAPYNRDFVWDQKVLSKNVEQSKLRVGIVHAPPFADKDDRNADDQLAVEIARRVLSFLGVQCELDWSDSFEELIEKLLRGAIDIISPILLESPHYLVRGLQFSDSVGLAMTHVVLFSKGTFTISKTKKHTDRLADISTGSRLSRDDFSRIEFIRLRGGTSALFVSQLPAESTFTKIYESKDRAEAFKALSAQSDDRSRFRGLITSTGTAMIEDPNGSKYDRFGLPYELDIPMNFVFGLHPREEKLLNAVNRALRQMKSTGSLFHLFEAKRNRLNEYLLDSSVVRGETLKDRLAKLKSK
jgi:ABC-type amino acid transport substrate-binding protein